jgi:ComF family protein
MKILSRLLDFLLPTACKYCNNPVGDSGIPFFCSTCWSDFSVMSGPLCPRCGRPFESSETLTHSPDHLCLACRQSLPVFDQALSIGYFEGPLREAIHQFKYRPCRSLAKPLALWAAGNMRPVQGIDIILPIPLHTTRLRERGFNQALLLADYLGKTFNIEVCFDNLKRTRPTKPQVELTGAERIKNVAGAFGLTRPGDIAGRAVLLIDDVFTTGATMNECARVLKAAGCPRLAALTIARAV